MNPGFLYLLKTPVYQVVSEVIEAEQPAAGNMGFRVFATNSTSITLK